MTPCPGAFPSRPGPQPPTPKNPGPGFCLGIVAPRGLRRRRIFVTNPSTERALSGLGFRSQIAALESSIEPCYFARMSDDDRTLPSSEKPVEKFGFPDEYTCNCGGRKNCPTVRLEPDGSVVIFEPNTPRKDVQVFSREQARELRQWLESKGF